MHLQPHLSLVLSKQRVSGQQQRVSLPGQDQLSGAAELQQSAGELLCSGPAEAPPAAGSQHHSVQADRSQKPDSAGASEPLEPVVLQEVPAGKETEATVRFSAG